MTNQSFTLPKGEYFFGDPGYLFNKDDAWEAVFCNNAAKKGDGVFKYKNKDYLMIGIGSDGWFRNSRGENMLREVPVDSGSLGLIPIEVIEPSILTEAIEGESGFIYSSKHQIQIDVISYCGLHVYPKRDLYCGDDAILISTHESDFDNAYFDVNCPTY